MRLLVLTVWFGWTGIFLSHAHAQTAVTPTAGDGLTTATAFQITEIGNLVWLGERAAANDTAGKYYQLMNDLDVSDTANWNDAATTTDVLEGFHPIGTYSSPDRTSFRGIFNGNGKKVVGLTINRSATAYMGLFGCVGGSGRIRNLTLEEGRVTGAACVGGMVGNNAGRLIGCSSNVPVVGTGESVGGLVGNCEGGRVTNGTSSGSVTGTGQVGGLVGTNFIATLENCSASGKVLGSGTFGGGLIGYNSGSITDCFATGAVTADGTVGGLIGLNYAKIQSCFATGPVTGNRYTGGLVGENEGSLSNCFATGSVTGYNCSGGLVGLCWQSGMIAGTISNCFAAGPVTGNANSTGGLVGDVLSGTVSNSYWDKTTTGQVISDGSAASFGKTTEEMKHQATFQPGGGTGASDWDFSSVWKIIEGQTYPYFQSARPPFRLSLAMDAFGSLTLNPSGTTVYPPGTTVTYAPGTTVTLTATPDPKYRFLKWTGPVADPTTASTTVLMDAHKSVTAHFEFNEYKLSVEATSGSVTVSPDQPTYSYGTVVTLTATPDAGYRFAGWTGNVADRTAASTSLVITGNMTVTARFLRGYEIRTLEELQAIATGDLTGYYILMNDIDASATVTWNDAGTTTDMLEGFNPIGTYSYSSPDTVSFRGVFDGNGKKITGLTINRLGGYYIGLFGAVGAGGTIRDLTLEGESVTGGLSVGGLAGYNTEGSISRCVARGTVRANKNDSHPSEVGDGGGLVGINLKGVIADCSVFGQVTGTVSYLHNAFGGLVGINNAGSILNSFTICAVEGEGPNDVIVGGLVGKNNGSIQTSLAIGPVKGNLTSNPYNLYVGGLVGSHNEGTLADSFATGAVSGVGKYYPPNMGGLVGRIAGGTVTHCFSVGPMPDKGSYIGGLIGRVSGGTVTACYWDIETSGQSTSAGGTGAIGKYSGTMKRQATFQPEGGTGATDWDFASVWGIVEGQTYPYLRSTSQPPLLYLDVSVSGPGSVTLDPPGGVYAPGTTVTLTATAAAGYHLAEWTGTVTDRGAEVTTIILDTHKSVTARFLQSHEIRTLEELQALTSAVPGEYYILMNDIDASATATWNDAGTTTDTQEGFRPIGTYSSTTPDTTSFRAIFDGNGKTITGLTINRPSTSYVGLFGVIGADGAVRNLTLEGGQVTGSGCVGGLAGLNLGRGQVNGCTTSNAVTGKQYVGGLMGENRGGTIQDCSASGIVTTGQDGGGLVGYNDYGGTISSSFATGHINGEGKAWYISTTFGGLVGYNKSGLIENCYATGSVTGQVENSIMTYAGGLIGLNSYFAITTNCYATGSVTVKSGYEGAYLGGLIGFDNGSSVSNCFATGRVIYTSAGLSFLGGLIGYGGSTVSACYWDVETSGLTVSAGGAGAVGKMTAEMKQKATFQPGGGAGTTDWDFTSVWGIVEGQSYPYLGPSAAPPSFRLDVSVQGKGSVALDPPGGVYAAGTRVTLTAVPEAGSHFAEWNGSVTAPRTDSFTVTMDTHKSVTARFLSGHEIRTLEELQAVATGDLTEYYILMNDIDASPTATWNDAGTTTDTLEGFQPIGTFSYPDTTSFRGIFDGNGKKIAGLTINRAGGSYIGLFGRVGKSGEVRNLTLEGGKIEGRSLVGAIAGLNTKGLLSNCSVSVPVTGFFNVGSVVGYNEGSIFQCSAIGGGVHLKITTETLASAPKGGGLVGQNAGTIIQCFSKADVVSDGAGGEYSPCIGGLVGNNSKSVLDSFATGAVNGQNCGGLIGFNSGSAVNCFAAGEVTGTSESVGGLIGSSTTTATVTACYWDVETTSQSTSAGGGAGKTTAAMKQQATFQPGGGIGATDWNFSIIWEMTEGETYPFLRFAPPSFGLNIAVEGEGSVELNPAGGVYAWGSQVTLTARPGAGSRFARWTGDVPAGGAGQNPLKIRIQNDTSLTVRFEAAAPQPGIWMLW